MSDVYIIHWLAKEVSGDFISSMIEYVTTDRQKAEDVFKQQQFTNNIVNINGHNCEVLRQIVQAQLDQMYK